MKHILFWSLITAIFISGLQVVISRHEARKLFIEIQALEQTRDELNEEWTRLLLEQSTWATDMRIEEMARTELAMHPPGTDTVYVPLPAAGQLP